MKEKNPGTQREREGVILVVHDLPRPDIGGRNRVIAGIRRTLIPVVTALIGWVAWARSRRGAVAVAANDYATVALRHWILPESILPYEGRVLRLVEEEDYSRLHRFADALDRISRRMGAAGGGFEHEGVSLVRIHEIRWIWHVAYAEASLMFFEQELRARGWRRLAAMGIGPQLPGAVRALRKVGGRPSLLTQAMERLAEALEYLGHRRFLRRMLPHYLQRVSKGLVRPPTITAKRSGERRLLVIGNFDRTMDRLEHLMPALSRAGFEVHLVGLPRLKSIERLAAVGVHCSLVGDWMEPAELAVLDGAADAKSKRWWAEMKEALGDVAGDHESRDLFNNVRPILKAHVRYGARGAMMAATVGRRAVERIQPDIVMNFEDWDFNRATSMIAAEHGIPSVAYYCLSAAGHAGLVRRTQSWMAVGGENLRRSFSGQYRADRIRLVGDPLAVPINELPDGIKRSTFRQTMNLDMERPLIVILSSYPVSGLTLLDIETVFRRTFAAVRLIKGAQIVVKTHPAQSVSQVRGWMKAWDCDDAPVLHDVSLFNLCASADLVSVPVTSAVHQALMAGVPVVCLQSRESVEPFERLGFDYLSGKGIIHVPLGTDAASMFQRLIFDPALRAEQILRGFAHVEEHSGPLDGRASERFADFLEEILQADGANLRNA